MKNGDNVKITIDKDKIKTLIEKYQYLLAFKAKLNPEKTYTILNTQDGQSEIEIDGIRYAISNDLLEQV